MECPTSHSITPLLICPERRKYVGKKKVSQVKGSLIKQKIHVKAKEDKRFILCLPSAGNVQQLPRIQHAWQLLQTTNAVIRDASLFSFKRINFYCWAETKGSVGSAFLAGSSPMTLPTSSLVGEGECWRDIPGAVPVLLRAAKAILYLSSYQHTAQNWEGWYGGNCLHFRVTKSSFLALVEKYMVYFLGSSGVSWPVVHEYSRHLSKSSSKMERTDNFLFTLKGSGPPWEYLRIDKLS